MVPPWVPDIIPSGVGATPLDTQQQDDTADDASGGRSAEQRPVMPIAPTIPIAPAARFGNTRRSLGEFARSGNLTAMRRGVSRYIQGGYGGRATATRRFAGTAATAQSLYSALGGAGAGTGRDGSVIQAADVFRDNILSTSRSVDDVMDAVIEAVRPVDGTQDGEASRAAIKDALSDLLTKFPRADLLNLHEEQREFAIERFIAADVFRRFDLDVGQCIKDKAPTAKAALARLKEVRDYVRETVSAAFRRIRNEGKKLAGSSIANVVRSTLDETFKVFEEYAE